MAEGTPRWRRVVVLLVTATGVAVTVSLGQWQLSRAGQKEGLQAALERQGSLPAVDLNALDAEAASGEPMRHRAASLRGSWLADHTVFLDNRQMNGRPGFYVMTPLRLEGRDEAVIVQRGWVPRDVQDRTRLPAVSTPAGPVALAGRIAPPPAKLYEFQAAGQGRIRQNLDVPAYSQEVGLALWPISFVQSAAPAAADDGLLRDWPQPAVDVHKHYGYAFQWFSLAALMAGLYVWFQIIQPRLRRAL